MTKCLFCSDGDLMSSWERFERKGGGGSLAPSVWIQVYDKEEMNFCVAKAVVMGPVTHFDLIASHRLNALRWLELKCCFLISSVLIMLLIEIYGLCIYKVYLILFMNSSLLYLLEKKKWSVLFVFFSQLLSLTASEDVF